MPPINSESSLPSSTQSQEASLEEINRLEAELQQLKSRQPQDSDGWQPIRREVLERWRRPAEKQFYVGGDGLAYTTKLSAIRANAKQLRNPSQLEHSNSPEEQSFTWSEPWKKTATEWRIALMRIPEFRGNVENAVQLLLQFSQGMESVLRRVSSVQNATRAQTPAFQPPDLAISFGKGEHQTMILYRPHENVVVIGRDYLSNLSKLNPVSTYALLSNTFGETIFKGRIQDYARLAGLEEAQHAERKQRLNWIEPGVPEAGMRLAEYDARDAEFEALLGQLTDANAEKMPIETILFLEERIRNAQKIRRLQKR